MIVARQFTTWDPLGKERRRVRDGVSKSDRTSLSILCGKQSCIFGSYRPSGTGPFFLHSQAVNCLATIILSLRDVGVDFYFLHLVFSRRRQTANRKPRSLLDYTEVVGFCFGMFARWVFASAKGVVCWFAGVSLICLVASSGWAVSSKELRVGYQKSGALLLTKTSGLLEKALAPLGYSVVWREVPSGLPLVEALNGGSIDIGHSGDAPLLFAQAAGIPFQIFAASNPSPESTGVVVPKDSPIHSSAELKRETIAFAKGSSSHLVVARLLAREGLQFSDINPVYLEPPVARAAFEAKAVDSWAVWDPFLAAAEVGGGA